MGAEYVRRAWARIQYNNVDISESLQEYLSSVEYTDALTGKADDLQLTLQDKKGLWLSDWFPDKGATLDGWLVTKYWNSTIEAEKELAMGSFEIDEIEASGAPNTVKLKAVSVPDNATLRGIDITKQWEKVTIKQVAQEKATNAKLELHYEAEENPVLDRLEQTEQSDLSFLYKLCTDNGLALKITDKTMVIFDVKQLEAIEPSLCLLRPGMNALTEPMYDSQNNPIKQIEVDSWSLSTKTRDIYKACRVEYQKAKKKQKIEATFTDLNKTVGKTLVVKEEVADVAEALRKAKKKLREKNSNEITGQIKMRGDTDLSSGLTVLLKGYGHFDGKYLLTEVRHSLGNGYTCDIRLRRCLVGY